MIKKNFDYFFNFLMRHFICNELVYINFFNNFFLFGKKLIEREREG
jgi:hypothetical protein